MSRAELEARVQMVLNSRLNDVNTFIQRHADQWEQLDRSRDHRDAEIRTQLQRAEYQLRVSCCCCSLCSL